MATTSTDRRPQVRAVVVVKGDTPRECPTVNGGDFRSVRAPKALVTESIPRGLAARAPFVFSYYLGYRSVADASAAWRGSRADFFACLYGRMDSPRSLHHAAELSMRSP